jgi:hypothetical protein
LNLEALKARNEELFQRFAGVAGPTWAQAFTFRAFSAEEFQNL